MSLVYRKDCWTEWKDSYTQRTEQIKIEVDAKECSKRLEQKEIDRKEKFQLNLLRKMTLDTTFEHPIISFIKHHRT